MDIDSDLILMAMLMTTATYWYITRRKFKNKRRRWWVRPINRQRNERGQYIYFKHMKQVDEDQFFKYTRMSVALFDKLLSIIKPSITKHSPREPINAECRLAITLQYLSQGGSMQQVAWAFHCSKSVVSNIVFETCQAIWDHLSPTYLKAPTHAEWLQIADGYWKRWNLPNTLGALDGKHVVMQSPMNSGSLFFNYKKQFSIVLLAICDHNYCFRLVDIGGYGGQSDGGILSSSEFGKALECNRLNIPEPSRLPNSEILSPYFFVGDEAFPLKENLLRPYPGGNLNGHQKTFNYRLSRARRTIENAFGILAARWRVFRFPIIAQTETVEKIVQATICLHNYIKMSDENLQYCPVHFVDYEENGHINPGSWRQEVENMGAFLSIGHIDSNIARRSVYAIRDTIAAYLTSALGSVPWQMSAINRGSLPDVEVEV